MVVALNVLKYVGARMLDEVIDSLLSAPSVGLISAPVFMGSYAP